MNKKNIALYAITIALLLLIFEGLSFLLYSVNPFSVFGWQYYDDVFQELKTTRVSTGWDNYGRSPRPASSRQDHACMSAFGDSFTHGDEVEHDQAWSHIASTLLGCEIENYGVGGFGTDQAYVLFNEIAPHTPIVLVGVYQEMLRRNLSASWAYYGFQKTSTLKPYFSIVNGDLTRMPFPADASLKAVKDYHARDRYYLAYKMGFPYSVSLLKALFYRVNGNALRRSKMLPPETVYKDVEATHLEQALLDKFRDDTRKNHQKLALLFFPTAQQAMDGDFPYLDFLKSYQASHPEVCIIDPGPALRRASLQENRPLAAPVGHFDVMGNRVIADEVNARLRACGLAAP